MGHGGGYRPGAGRPRKIKVQDMDNEIKISEKDIQTLARMSGLTPLEYMLQVMNDDNVDPNRRDRMAIAAAPFLHAKQEAQSKLGKKEKAQMEARTAEEGTSWEGLLVN
jgi:hypothetical protein